MTVKFCKKLLFLTLGPVRFETSVVCQFLIKIPTDLLSAIIPAKFVISKSKLS